MSSFSSFRGPLWVGAVALAGSIGILGGTAFAAEARACSLQAAAPAPQQLFAPALDPSSGDALNVPGSRIFMHRGAGALVVDVSASARPSAFARDAASDGSDQAVPVEPLGSDGRFKITWPLAPGRIVQRLTISDGRPATLNTVTIFAVSVGGLVPADSDDGAADPNELRGATVSFALPGGLGCLRLRNLSVAAGQAAMATFTPGDDGMSALRLTATQLVKLVPAALASQTFSIPYEVRLPSSATVAGSFAIAGRSITPTPVTISNVSPLTIGPVSLTPTSAALAFGTDGSAPAGLTLQGSVKLGAAFGGGSTSGGVTVAFTPNGLACSTWTFAGGPLFTVGGNGAVPKIVLSVDPSTVACGSSTFAFDGRFTVSAGSGSPQDVPFRARYENGLHITAPDGTPSVKLSLSPAASIRFGTLTATISDAAFSADPATGALLLTSRLSPVLQNLPELTAGLDREYTLEIAPGTAGAALRARCPAADAQPRGGATIKIGNPLTATIANTSVRPHCTGSNTGFVDGLSVFGGTVQFAQLGAINAVSLPCFAVVEGGSGGVAFARVDDADAKCGPQKLDASTISLIERGSAKAALTLPQLKLFDTSSLTLDELALTVNPGSSNARADTSPLSIRVGATITLPHFLGDDASVQVSGYRLDLATFHQIDPGTYTAPSSLHIAGFSFNANAGAPLFQRCSDTYLIQGRMLLPDYLRGGDRRIVLKHSAKDIHLADTPTTLSTPAPTPTPVAAQTCPADAAPGAAMPLAVPSPATTASPSASPAPTASPSPSPSRVLAANDKGTGLDFFFRIGAAGIVEANVTSFHPNTCAADANRHDDWITLGPVNLCIKELKIKTPSAVDDIQTDMTAVITFNAFLTKGQSATVDAAFDNQRFRGHAVLDKVDARLGGETVGLTALDIAFEPTMRRIQGDVIVTVSQLRGTQFFQNGVGIEETRATVNDPWKARLLAGRPDYGRTGFSLLLNFLGDLAGALGFKTAGVLK